MNEYEIVPTSVIIVQWRRSFWNVVGRFQNLVTSIPIDVNKNIQFGVEGVQIYIYS
jgi:hypothetical protein